MMVSEAVAPGTSVTARGEADMENPGIGFTVRIRPTRLPIVPDGLVPQIAMLWTPEAAEELAVSVRMLVSKVVVLGR
jgi:hypothetical protein